MTDWALIAIGFVVATLGAAASMLYIVALSAAYVGKFGLAAGLLMFALVLALAFRRTLGPYLDRLDQRNSESPVTAEGESKIEY
jgi:membrane protein implicated in regulation of membrane protease activity